MKKVIEFIIAIALAVGLYLPCRQYGISERGNEAYGGEVLVPLVVFISYIWYEDWQREREERESSLCSE